MMIYMYWVEYCTNFISYTRGSQTFFGRDHKNANFGGDPKSNTSYHLLYKNMYILASSSTPFEKRHDPQFGTPCFILLSLEAKIEVTYSWHFK